MINEVNLAKMYEAYVNDGMVKAGSLKEMGFNYNDLHNLMAKGEIEKVSWGLYEVSRVDILYRYGVQLRETGDYLKARKVFLKCLDKDSNYIPAVLELMIIALREEKYEEVNDLFVWLLKVQEEYHKDIMYYLYLYGVVTEVPEIFKDYVKTLCFQDIKLEKQDGVLDIQVKNIIREYVMKRQFGKALKLWGNKEEQAVNSSGEVLESILLNKAYQKERCNSYKLNDLVKRRDYEGVNQLLEEKKESAGLTISEEWTKILVEKYLEIREGLVVPEVSVYWSRSPIEAILGNNFELAYNMTVEYQNKRGYKINNLAIILQDIIKLVNNITNIERNMAVSIQGIKLFLKRGDMDRVLDVLSKYLRFKKSAHYEFLVRDLLHISFLEGDLEYKKPLQLLDDLTREDYEFNLGKYVLELYQAISEGRCDIARVYLDILNKAKNLGYDFRLGREIELFLEQQENKREENQDIDLKL